MRLLLTCLLTLLVAFAAPAIAAPLDETRAAHAAAAAAFDAAQADRAALDRTHEALAAEIEALKAAEPTLPGVRDPRLDDRLKRARAIAEQLAALDRAVSEARETLDARRRALMSALDEALTASQTALASAPALDRRARFEDMRRLIDERQALARSLTHRPQKQPALPAPPTDEVASPDELRELADETRDHAEQVQSRLSMLTQRLAELRERQRLVQAATAFSRDDALFAQDERNRQIVRREDGVAAATPTPTPRPVADDDKGQEVVDAVGNDQPEAMPPAAPDDSPDPDGDAADPEESFGAGGEGRGDGAEFDGPGGALDGITGEVDPPPEALPAGGLGPEGGSVGAVFVEEAFDPTRLDELDDLSPEALARRIEAIEARRARLERTRAALEARGDQLEQRARALESESP